MHKGNGSNNGWRDGHVVGLALMGVPVDEATPVYDHRVNCDPVAMRNRASLGHAGRVYREPFEHGDAPTEVHPEYAAHT